MLISFKQRFNRKWTKATLSVMVAAKESGELELQRKCKQNWKKKKEFLAGQWHPHGSWTFAQSPQTIPQLQDAESVCLGFDEAGFHLCSPMVRSSLNLSQNHTTLEIDLDLQPARGLRKASKRTHAFKTRQWKENSRGVLLWDSRTFPGQPEHASLPPENCGKRLPKQGRM